MGIHEKIGALFRLADNNSSEEESAAALALARRLMQEHNLRESEIAVDLGSAPTAPTGGETATDVDGKFYVWKWGLANVIASYFDVKSFRRRTRISSHRIMDQRMVFYGVEQNTQLAAAAFASVYQQIQSMARGYGGWMNPGMTAKNEYRLGIIEGLRRRFETIRREESSACTALAVRGAEIADNWLQSKGTKLKNTTTQARAYNSMHHFNSGVADSTSVTLTPALDK